MSRLAQTETIECGPDQYALANSLVDCLGVDGAIHACEENLWFGVLAIVSKTKLEGGDGDARSPRELDFTGWHPYTVEEIAARQGIQFP